MTQTIAEQFSADVKAGMPPEVALGLYNPRLLDLKRLGTRGFFFDRDQSWIVMSPTGGAPFIGRGVELLQATVDALLAARRVQSASVLDGIIQINTNQ